jgi:uncharacterized membrane protein YcaP (DUF421 family)
VSINWHQVFTPDISLFEMFIRGTCVYWALFLMLRFGSKREAGSVGLADMLVIVVIADAAQNAMSSTYTSVTSGLVLVATILMWDFIFDFLVSRFPKIESILKPHNVCLVKNSRIIWKNMRSEMITRNDLMEALRLQDIQELSQVKSALMESDGKISVVRYK